jgi:hypothetical protein
MIGMVERKVRGREAQNMKEPKAGEERADIYNYI